MVTFIQPEQTADSLFLNFFVLLLKQQS